MNVLATIPAEAVDLQRTKKKTKPTEKKYNIKKKLLVK